MTTPPIPREGDGLRRNRPPFAMIYADTFARLGDFPHSVTRVFIALTLRADRATGECFPSYTTLARVAGVSRSVLATALTTLIDAGLLTSAVRVDVAGDVVQGRLYTVREHPSEIDTPPETDVEPVRKSDRYQSENRTGTGPDSELEPVRKSDSNKNHLTRPNEPEPKQPEPVDVDDQSSSAEIDDDAPFPIDEPAPVVIDVADPIPVVRPWPRANQYVRLPGGNVVPWRCVTAEERAACDWEPVAPPTKAERRAGARATSKYPPEFEAFMDAYPHTGDVKKIVYERWAMIAPDPPTVAAIMAGLGRWRRSALWNRDDPMIVWPRKWLAERRWEAFPPSADGSIPYGQPDVRPGHGIVSPGGSANRPPAPPAERPRIASSRNGATWGRMIVGATADPRRIKASRELGGDVDPADWLQTMRRVWLERPTYVHPDAWRRFVAGSLDDVATGSPDPRL